jgi:hypothetical protein
MKEAKSDAPKGTRLDSVRERACAHSRFSPLATTSDRSTSGSVPGQSRRIRVARLALALMAQPRYRGPQSPHSSSSVYRRADPWRCPASKRDDAESGRGSNE